MARSKPKSAPAPAVARPAAPRSPGAEPLPAEVFWGVGGAVTLFGLVLRLVLLLSLARTIGYMPDHNDFGRWGIQAVERGLLTLYSEPPPKRPLQVWNGARWVQQHYNDRICNYPPGATYLLAFSGAGFEGAGGGALNSTGARAWFSIWGILADFVLAAGCAALVGLVANRKVVLYVYGVAVFYPPFWWDSAIWGQMDTVVLAPLVWMVYFLLRERYLTAGILWGVALSLKTQAILAVPVWAAVLVLHTARPRVLIGAAVAAGTLFVLALPFTLQGLFSPSAGAFDWATKSYGEPVGETYAQYSTLKAFNLWYLDALVYDSLNANETVGGLSKRHWGYMALALGLIGSAAFATIRWRQQRLGLVVWTLLVMLCAVMLPTNVHERYLILALPWLLILAARGWQVWPGLLALTFVMLMQLGWPLWYEGLAPGALQPAYAEIDALFEPRLAEANEAEQAALLRMRDRELEPLERAYRQRRADVSGMEWGLTWVALAGTVLTVMGLASLAADSSNEATDEPGPQAPSAATI